MSFAANREGTCSKCQTPIYPGQFIQGRRGEYSHVECPAPEDTGCLICGQECKHQRINAVENADMEDFLIDFDRGCPAGCKCGGLNYHIKDFCSIECLAEGATQYEQENSAGEQNELESE
jgi:hypothetical protein